MWMHEKISIDDSHISTSERTTDIVNIGKTMNIGKTSDVLGDVLYQGGPPSKVTESLRSESSVV